MLQVSYIRENREEVLSRLSVRNFKNPELVDQIIKLDDDRRQTQTLLDSIAAEANAAAKKVGELMRQGLKEEAEAIKAQTTTFKEQTRTLGDKLSAIEILLQAELVLLPNLPHQSVPKASEPMIIRLHQNMD
jgi:seryl-tRNA synthetase